MLTRPGLLPPYARQWAVLPCVATILATLVSLAMWGGLFWLISWLVPLLHQTLMQP